MLLKLKDITKSFSGVDGDVEVLRGVSLGLHVGETLALTGESGSGKSTILHISAGLEVPDGGSLHLEGVEINELSEAERANLRRSEVGIVFQQFNLIPSLTVEANIGFQASLAGRRDKTFESELVEALGLEDQLKKYPESLSGGQQQRVAIARALAVRPKLLLADEPTGNLDESTASAVLTAMLDLVGRTGAALMVVTHSAALAEKMDRRVRLKGGVLL
ncbi:MAG: ABC transporter ATP-binding protein [Rhodobacteraceae bacterium]|nr:ABC transporter ATP-binding protein [Rhodobacterales bacterium]NCW06925.1 ABC transporter ATP-binding protein [Rhodobacterales bacterium]NCX28889.1 ABC transporter ATP-binding protein [Rhodobacterales bacterium]NCX92300.1 ABC transporter ATP-binding protein [Paracoccaceae bacterium]